MSALVAVVSGFASGVFLRSLFFLGWPLTAFGLLLASLFGAAYFLKERRAYALIALFFLCGALGTMRLSLTERPLPEIFLSDLKQRVSYDGVVAGDPDVREKNQRIALRIEKEGSAVGILAVMPLSAEVKVGDRVRVYGTLSLPHAFETENGRTFRYDKYLEARGIQFLIQYGSIYTEEPAPWYSFPAALARVKHTFLDGLSAALPEPSSSLAGGIVIGGKSGLGSELQEAFERSGLVQIIVLSGYNIMIVAEWAMIFFASLRLPRKVQYAAGGIALLLFVGIAGISATAVRAAIMALIALYARATGRSYAASRALLFAVLLMLLWNPLYLCFDPGFALSVAATAGIIWFAPLIEIRLLRLRPFWRNAVATTLAAQLFVLPLLLYNIGLLSLVALPANLIVNPLVPFAMLFAAVAGLSGMIFGSIAPLVAKIIGLPAFLLTRFFIEVAERGAGLPFVAFTLKQFPFVLVLLSYGTLAYIAFTNRSSTTLQFKLLKKAST